MEFRKTVEADISGIMDIISQAQLYLKGKGIDQWQNNYPNIDTVRNDIANGMGYVLTSDREIVGTVALSFEVEKDYKLIHDGKWLGSGPYAAVHRIAVTDRLKGTGLASLMIGKILGLCGERDICSLRADTHRNNLSMQSLLKKNGFQYCGIIYLKAGSESGSERFAFERLIGG